MHRPTNAARRPSTPPVDSGVFIWRDCPTGEWRVKTAAGGGAVIFSGSITAAVNYTSVKPVALVATDVIDYTTNPQRIAFSFNTKGTSSDGVNFRAPDGTSVCMKIDAPAGVKVLYGPFRSQVAQPLDLETQSPVPPSGVGLGAPGLPTLAPMVACDGSVAADQYLRWNMDVKPHEIVYDTSARNLYAP